MERDKRQELKNILCEEVGISKLLAKFTNPGKLCEGLAELVSPDSEEAQDLREKADYLKQHGVE